MYECSECWSRANPGAAAAAAAAAAADDASFVVDGLPAVARPLKSKSEPARVVKRPATKQLLLERAPEVLTLHLKRFEQQGFRLNKVSKHVAFGLELDLAPFCSLACPLSEYPTGAAGIRYDLFGVVEHQGKMQGGHYVCYAKNPAGEWVHISDSSVSGASVQDVLRAEAYILFYKRRRSAPPLTLEAPSESNDG